MLPGTKMILKVKVTMKCHEGTEERQIYSSTHTLLRCWKGWLVSFTHRPLYSVQHRTGARYGRTLVEDYRIFGWMFGLCRMTFGIRVSCYTRHGHVIG
jgi:hypothetical protein